MERRRFFETRQERRKRKEKEVRPLLAHNCTEPKITLADASAEQGAAKPRESRAVPTKSTPHPLPPSSLARALTAPQRLLRSKLNRAAARKANRFNPGNLGVLTVGELQWQQVKSQQQAKARLQEQIQLDKAQQSQEGGHQEEPQ